VDKDEAYGVIEALFCNAQHVNLRNAISMVANVYAELESLRAMRKRVEGLVDSWSDSDQHPETRFCAADIYKALGDSHE
jgi:ABC-type uncharacterized transport system fused permease/ATPase subunit